MINFILAVIYFILCLFVIKRVRFFHLSELNYKQLFALFSLKVFTGLLLWYIYTYHYTLRNTSDAFRYFDDALIPYKSLYTKPIDYLRILFGINTNDPYLIKEYFEKMNNWYLQYDYNLYNDNRTIIRFNMLVMPLSMGNYHVHTILINLLSFTGATALFKAMKYFFQKKITLLVIATFLIPSFLFWGSGVLKEGLLIFILGFLLLSFVRFKNSNKLKFIGFFLFFTSFLLLSKVYVLLAILPPLFCWYISDRYKLNYPLALFSAVLLLFFIIAFNFKYINSNYDFAVILMDKQKDFINVAIDWNAGSFIRVSRLDGTAMSVLKNIPESLFNVLFRPLFFDKGGPFIVLASLENLFFLICILLAFLFSRKLNREEKNFALFCSFFCLILFLIIGWVTPILGAMVRYKVPGLPFLYVFVFLFFDSDKLLSKFSFLTKINRLKNKLFHL